MDATQRADIENTETEDNAAEEAAFEAAFGATDLEPGADDKAGEAADPAGEELTEGNEEAAADPAAELGTEQAAKTPTIEDLLAIIEDSKTEQAKLRDKVFGKMGELQQKFDAVKSTAHGISPKARERLQTDFPELAEMLFEDATTVDPQAKTEPAAQAAAVTTVIPDDGKEMLERRLLTKDHKDWEQVVISGEFATWVDTVLSPEDAAALNESWDADFVSAKLTEFKAYTATQSKADEQKKLKQSRLETAINPRGNPRVNQTGYSENEEEAAMLQNFKPR
jgi:hypothetical protein